MAHPASPGARFTIWLLSTLLVLPAQLVFAGGAVFSVGGIFMVSPFVPSMLLWPPLGLAAAAMCAAMIVQLSIVSRVHWWQFRMRLNEVARAQHGAAPVQLRSTGIRLRATRYAIEVARQHPAPALTSARAREFPSVSKRWAHPLALPRPQNPCILDRLWVVGLALVGVWLLVMLVVWLVHLALGA
jgi:hypothetical protein